MHEHGLRVRYIWQIVQGGTSGEHDGTWRQVSMEWYLFQHRGSELKLTCEMRAALAGLNRLRQEYFQAFCYVSDTFPGP